MPLELRRLATGNPAIGVLVVAFEPARRRGRYFICGQYGVAVGVHQIEKRRRMQPLEPPAATAEFIDRQLAVTVDIGGADQTALLRTDFIQRHLAVAIGVDQLERAGRGRVFRRLRGGGKRERRGREDYQRDGACGDHIRNHLHYLFKETGYALNTHCTKDIRRCPKDFEQMRTWLTRS